MYGCDGKNRAFEFDGTVMSPISTGIAVDTPAHLAIHKWHFFLSFFGSIQHSAPGDPIFNAITGAGEIGLGSSVTGFLSLPGTQTSATLAVFSLNEVSILYGTSALDWNLAVYKKEVGAYENTIKIAGNIFFLDERGITTIAPSQVYGNFETAVVSKAIQSWISGKGASVKDSCVVREKNQYRLFFSDGSALYLTQDNGAVQGIMPIVFVDPVECVCSSEDAAGSEAIFFGSTDGFVYQMERGTSFDGDEIESFLELAYNHYGSPHITKRWRKMVLGVSGEGYSEVYAGYFLNYGDGAVVQAPETLLEMGLNALFWDDGLFWDAGLAWDGASILPLPMYMSGSGYNLSIQLRSNSDCFSQMKVSGAQILYTPSRIMR